MYRRSLFWFRQDLRLEDNIGLTQALQQSKELFPIFIFDSTILENSPSQDRRVDFLVQAIKLLEQHLRVRGSQLAIFYGDPVEIIPQIVREYEIDALFANKSYGIGAQSRDRRIQERAKSISFPFHLSPDFLLVEPDALPARKVFTPFSKLRYRYLDEQGVHSVGLPDTLPPVQHTIGISWTEIVKRLPKYLPCYRSADEGQKLLNEFEVDLYPLRRNLVGEAGTSRLSPYIRFGLLSIRQVFLKFRGQTIFTNELAWREFWQHIYHHFPETYLREFQEKKRHIAWKYDEKLFDAWSSGQTGYPIVDAAMRQLKQENRMHGRARMIVASFLSKDLLIDWRWGEQWFAKYLIDYDTNVNQGNRQRSASVGADPKPLRIFNPILQSQKFDPDGAYILRYIPELQGQPIEAIHDPLRFNLAYTSPIIDHYEASKQAKLAYRSV